MSKLLKTIATIKTGVYCTLGAEGDAIYLQAADLQPNGVIIPSLKPNLQITGNLQNRLLDTNDIIFMAKGVNNLAYTYNKVQYPYLIPSTAFLIISNLHHSVLPAYLTWYINQPSVTAINLPAMQITHLQAVSILMLLAHLITFNIPNFIIMPA